MTENSNSKHSELKKRKSTYCPLFGFNYIHALQPRLTPRRKAVCGNKGSQNFLYIIPLIYRMMRVLFLLTGVASRAVGKNTVGIGSKADAALCRYNRNYIGVSFYTRQHSVPDARTALARA